LKKLVFLISYIVFALAIISCAPKTTYDTLEFLNAMEQLNSRVNVATIYIDGEKHYFMATAKYSLSDTETLYFIPWVPDVISEEDYLYIIVTDDPNKDEVEVSYPSYKELCRIFNKYLADEIEEPETTTTCVCG